MTDISPLARQLLARRKHVLDAWCARVDADRTLDDRRQWSRQQFVDHLPELIEQFAAGLAKQTPAHVSPDEAPLADSHARHRWLQGFSLRAVVREWGHLNACMVLELEDLACAEGACAETRRAVLERWSVFLADQMSESAARYHELQQSEAATRARELEEVALRLRRLEGMRAQQLDSTTRALRSDVSLLVTTARILDGASMDEVQRSEFRKMFQAGFQSVDETLRDLATLSQLEAGLRKARANAFDAGALLASQCSHFALQANEQGAQIRCHGEEHFEVRGDERHVGSLVEYLVQFALRATDGVDIDIHWSRDPKAARWSFRIEHAAPEGLADVPLAQTLADATQVASEVVPDALVVETAPLSSLETAGGVKLSIAKRLCELLDASFEYGWRDGLAIYRVSLPLNG